jgi:predicted DNA-binding protein with PD1-like motif
VAIGVHRSEKSRHLVLRVSAGEPIPDALASTLGEEQVTCGWLCGGGVLADVELRAYDAQIGALGTVRRIEGPVQVLTLEGTIGLSNGAPSLSMRVLLARESDRGLETLAGELRSANTVALEVFVTALDDVSLEHALDDAAGVWLLGAGPGGSRPRLDGTSAALPRRGPHQDHDSPSVQETRAARARSPRSTAWSAALEASDRTERDPHLRLSPAGTGAGAGAAIPARPPKRGPDLDTVYPEAGDAVDHFAFGPCDVLKSDGDRLHLKLHKDGRIREIALGMLRVSRQEDANDGRRRFRLERRI